MIGRRKMSSEYDQLAHEAAKAYFVASEARKRYWDGGDQDQSEASLDKLMEQANTAIENMKQAEEAYWRAWVENEPEDYKARKPKAEFE
jgi:hypothetical protein